ncbi:neuronal acetylcholine receptor subunit alpha-6-like [Amphiura filiformis]|uniref:neuronal acetylcholine receptor subunit alpha-6-like n=1 Tax=Amphiura filiformis TaxID=82378 RepID=UPI003B21814C
MAYVEKAVVLLLFAGFYAVAVLGQSPHQKLVKNLLDGYDRVTPPSTGGNATVIDFTVNINQIQTVNEQENSISLNTWIKMLYVDNRLSWDPANYSGIAKVRIPYQQIWVPDIILWNGLAGSQLYEDKLLALVDSKGSVVAIPPMALTASCNMDLTFFPYDTQTCELKFGSWTYDASVIALKLLSDKPDISEYREHPEWELVNSTMILNNKNYDCCPNDTYQDVTVTLELKRQAGPYAVKLVVPSVLTAFLILFTFILPSSSGEKIVFCLVLLLSLILLSVYLHITVPSNSESVMGEFLTFALFLDFFATIIAVICYNIADALLMRDKLGGPESDKHWAARKRKLKILRIIEYVFFFLFLIIFIIGTAVILCRRG